MSNYGRNENELEQKVIKKLKEKGFVYNEIHSYSELLDNFIKHIVKLNCKAICKGKEIKRASLTNSEKERLLSQFNDLTECEAAECFNNKFSFKLDNGKTIYLRFFSENITENCFEVINQFQMKKADHKDVKKNNRFDITLLINGIPFSAIELKKPGVNLAEALRQINRYRNQSFKGLFRFLRILIISNGNITRYASNQNQKNEQGIRKNLQPENFFVWLDKDNKRIENIFDFIDDFLNQEMILKMLTIYSNVSTKSKSMVIARAQQFHATELAMKDCIELWDNGFIFHSTGSGKTLCSYFLYKRCIQSSKVDKVIFLTDRTDLDYQTVEAYQTLDENSVEHENNTKELVEKLSNNNIKGIATTIQKMNNACKKSKFKKTTKKIKDKKIVFIIDECHRSQFGAMHNNVIDNFFINSIKIGFTGTPILAKDLNEDFPVSTADLFVPKHRENACIHTYLLKDAIADNTVLSMNVINIDNPDITSRENFTNIKRMEAVAKDIIESLKSYTIDLKFNALFAVSNIKDARMYYEYLQKYNPGTYNIAIVYSQESNGKDESDKNGKMTNREMMVYCINNYNKIMGTNIDPNDYKSYKRDVVARLKGKKDGPKVHLCIVVDMLLTGFDSSLTNTLYVDKDLKRHNLIQAYSRTIRLADSNKIIGNIINYRDNKKEEEEAVKAYSGVDDINELCRIPYKSCLAEYRSAVTELRNICPDIAMASSIQSEKTKNTFVELTKRANYIYNKLIKYPCIDYKDINAIMPSNLLNQYISYKYEFEGEKKTRKQAEYYEEDINTDMTIREKHIINVDYILNLCKKSSVSEEEIIEKIQKSTLEEEAKRILENFIHDFRKKPTKNPHKSFQKYILKEFHSHCHCSYEEAEELFKTAITNKENITRNDLSKLARDSSLSAKELSQKTIELGETLGTLTKIYPTLD